MIAKGIGIAVLFAYFFYRSAWSLPFLAPVAIYYIGVKKKEAVKMQKKELSRQFGEAIQSVSVSLNAGYSIENAFLEAYRDMVLLFGTESDMANEILELKKGMHNNVSLEKLLLDFGERSGVEEIRDFAEVFSVAKRAGGDLNDMIRKTVTVIGDKMAVQTEIDTILSSKRLEQKIMNVVPFLLITYISMTSGGFFDPLYYNMSGIIIMTACMGIYLFACRLSDRIVTIEV